MTTQNRFFGTTVVAGADLDGAGSLYKAIAIGGTIAANNSTAFGLLQSKGKQNEHVTLGYFGEMKAHAGAGISVGGKLMITTSGYVITATSGTIGVGKALEAANSGDIFRGLFDFTNALIS
jgi:hypothetical protein